MGRTRSGLMGGAASKSKWSSKFSGCDWCAPIKLNGSGLHHVYVPQAGAAHIIKVSLPALITS